MKEIRVTRARKIFSNGVHNAFTSIVRFGGKSYVAFRSATVHASCDGKILVISSEDGNKWDVATVIEKAGLDLRDPKLTVFKNKIFLSFFVRRPQDYVIQSFMVSSKDGKEYSEPQEIQGMPLIWGIAARGECLYGTGYKREEDNCYHSYLFKSADGVNWEKLLAFPSPGNETAIDFDKDGTLWALVRDDQRGQVPALCKISSPYSAIESIRHLPIKIGGPMIKRFNGASVIIARCWSQDDAREQRYNTRADIFILEDFKELRHVRPLPSGGDCSYASWADIGEGKALVSYYSSHEHSMDAPCRDDKSDEKDVASSEHNTASDIYLADISYKI